MRSLMCVTIQVCIYCTLRFYEELQTSVYTFLCSVTLPVCIDKLPDVNISAYKSCYVGLYFNCYTILSCQELLNTTSLTLLQLLYNLQLSRIT